MLILCQVVLCFASVRTNGLWLTNFNVDKLHESREVERTTQMAKLGGENERKRVMISVDAMLFTVCQVKSKPIVNSSRAR